MSVNRLEKRYIRGPLQRWGDWPFLRYIVLGGLSFFLNIGLTVLFHEVFNFSEKISFSIALLIVFIVNFITVRTIVFNDNGAARRQFLLFFITSVISRVGEYALFLVIFSVFEINYIISISITLTSSILLKFFIYKNFIFKNHHKSKNFARGLSHE